MLHFREEKAPPEILATLEVKDEDEPDECENEEAQRASTPDNLFRSEELNATLEAEIKSMEDGHNQEREDWQASKCQIDAEEAEKDKQLQAVKEDKIRLHEQMEDQREQVHEKERSTSAENARFQGACEQLQKVQEEHLVELTQASDATKTMERRVQALMVQLEDEQKQKEETANRLQEYENRIASTCQDITQHEEAHQRENERLRAEQMQLDARVKDEQFRNAELQRLLQEKNEMIHQLIQNLKSASSQENVVKEEATRTTTLCQHNGAEYSLPVQEDTAVAPRSHEQTRYNQQNRGIVSETTQDSGSSIGSLLADINRSILTRTEFMGSKARETRAGSTTVYANGECAVEYRSPVISQSLAAVQTGADAEEHMIDNHTSKIHEDIRELQERISKRLKQAPAAQLAFMNGTNLAGSHRTSSADHGIMEVDAAPEEPSNAVANTEAHLPEQQEGSDGSQRSEDSASGQPESPGKSKQKTSPSKHHHKFNIDANASLAAVSAKLQPVLLPGESEIVRINREALRTVSKRYQQHAARVQDQQLAESNKNEDDDENDALTEGQSPTQKARIPPALQESIIAEEWVNVHLETNGAFLLPATDIQPLLQKVKTALGGNSDDTLTVEETFTFRKRGDTGPLGRAGIDRASLYRLGMPKDLVDRLYSALYVYTNGFHNIINEIAAHCPPLVEKHVSSNVWLTFLLLLEQCENGKYEIAMLKFKHATQEWRRQMQEEFANEKARLEVQLHVLKSNLTDEATQSAEKSDIIAKLAAEAVVANQTISDQQREILAQAEQIRLLKLEILVHEDDERKLNDQLDDARKDFEVANSERINALAERYALDEEVRKRQVELERVEAEKSNYAKRMHEGLFMNQALRATNETLKQNAVVSVLKKNKLSNEKESLHAQLDGLQQEPQDLKLQKARVEKELQDSQRKHQHLDTRIQTMKEQFEIEVVSNSKHVQEINHLKGEIDEEKVKVGVLEAKRNLLTAEKQNTGMRAQDKLRIERLLNQKLELENIVEAMKVDRAKDQEQIWNLRASLEALDTEMQHSKRVFSAGRGEEEEFEEEFDEEDVLDAHRKRLKLRRKGIILDDALNGDQLGDRASDGGEIGDSLEKRSQVTRMSKFRKSKLDKLVKKLQRDLENKSELVQSLEGVICEQVDQMALLTRTNEQQERWLRLNENQKGMLFADIDAKAIVLFEVHNAKETAELKMRQVETDRDIEIERALKMQFALENMRRQFDMQSAQNEDLQSKIWREYEHHLLMLSLRREKEVQATVAIADQGSQTLVPQRNPANDRARISSMYMPAVNPAASTFEDIIQQINHTAKGLLPGVASDITSSHSSNEKHGSTGGLNSAVPIILSTQRRRETDAQYRKRYERTRGQQSQGQGKGLPAIGQGHTPHIIRHFNEFGMRQDVLVSPVYPLYFADQSSSNGLGGPAISTTRLQGSPTTSKIPRKPTDQQHRRLQQVGGQGEERCSSPRQSNYRDPRRRSPRGINRKVRTQYDQDTAVEPNAKEAGDTGLRYHRGFLQTGMEVLRGSSGQQQFPEDVSEGDDYDDSEDEDSEDGYVQTRSDGRYRNFGQHESSLLPRSPGRLEVALRGYQGEQLEAHEQTRRGQLLRHGKHDEVRTSSLLQCGSDDDDNELDDDMIKELDHSSFVPAVLYPLLPPQ
ncbi:hypothetical protein FI667_g15884, partial [Globisporangium splendens]